MKKINFNLAVDLFDYEKEVGSIIYEKSICNFFDDTMVIYVKEATIKYHLNIIKEKLLNKAKKSISNLKMIEIRYDRLNLIEKRNENLNKNKEKIIKEKNLNGLNRRIEEISKNIKDLNLDDEYTNFINYYLERYKKSYDLNKKVCKICREKCEIYDICPTCLYYKFEREKVIIEKEILKNPYITNYNEKFLDIRKRLYDNKKYELIEYIINNISNLNEKKIEKYLIEASVYLIGSRDYDSIEYNVKKLKGELNEYFREKGYKVFL